MPRAWLNRNVIHPLAAWRNGRTYLQDYHQLLKTQYDSPEIIRNRQFERIQQLIKYCYYSVPYYTETWNNNIIHPNDIKTWEDFARLPILSKQDIRLHNDKLISTRIDRTQCITKTTSGSTGVPLKILLDTPAKEWKAAGTLRADEWSGWRLGERVAKVWGNPEYKQFGFRGRLRNAILDRAIYLCTLNITNERILDFGKALLRHQPGLLFGHAQSLALIAQSFIQQNISGVRPNGIISTAMPLHTWQREAMVKAFGINPCDRYGCEEVSLIAAECTKHEGLHINADSVYVEVLPRPGDPPGTGKILLTDLSNTAMPLVRYEVGDVGTLSSAKCSCGRGLPLLHSLAGREADFVVTPTGAMISGISLTENFAMHIRGAAQVQLVQESVHHLRVRLVVDDSYNAQSEREIAALVQRTLGPGVLHDVELVPQIEQEPSGKYRFCISKVKKGGM